MRLQTTICASSSALLLTALTTLAPASVKAPEQGNKTATRKTAAPNTAVSFHQDVEPFLKASCSSCHGADSHSSGFVVDTTDALFHGGSKFGAKVIVSGKASESLLVAYLRGTKQPRMPLGGAAVSEAQIKTIEAWINQGATVDAVKLGWPYTKPVAAPVPHVKNASWPQNPIDNFVLAKLEARGLIPAPPDSKSALLRRVYTDVVGVLPTPAESDQFLQDASPNAYEKLIDRLLADPRYGERWGRHWLDLVRYADTHGFENDGIRPRAWRYRDYVIKAFNEDRPYDQFLKEQIAGDEIAPSDPDAVVATGYIRLSPWDELSGDADQRRQDYLNDVTDTTGSVMLGLTVGCARCHDHKYDQIKQADYYRMQGFFVGTKNVDMPLPPTVNPPATQQKITESHAKLEASQQQVIALHDKFAALALAEKQKAVPLGTKVEVSDDDITAILSRPENKSAQQQNDALQAQIHEIESSLTPLEPAAEAVTDSGSKAPPQYILLRGNLHTPGPEVQPGFVASLVGGQEKPAVITLPPGGKTTGRRAALAEWIGSKNNPMTARVIVNRLWQFHFGHGIVGTPSDFGRNGEGPTHPELLDWLAVRLMKDGWSLKKMQRLMLLSATYRQSTQGNPLGTRAAKIDPGNKLFWHMNRIRMDAEALRDSILTVSGRLNPQMGGPGIYPKVSDEVLSTGSTYKWGSSLENQQLRRTVYVFQRRSLVLPLVEAFDGQDMNNTCPRRSVTTIAPQALALFDGEFGRTEAKYFAERVVREAGNNENAQIVYAYRIALGRPPTPSQIVRVHEYLTRKAQMYSADGQANEAKLASLADFCHVLINTNEFIYLD